MAPPRSYVRIASALTRGDLERFRRYVQHIELEAAVHVNGDGSGGPAPRRSNIAWLAPPVGAPSVDDDAEEEARRLPAWLFRKLRRCVARAARAWPRLAGAPLAWESAQLARYGVGEHYRQWHRDGDGVEDGAPRVFSLVVLLDACDKGGTFEVRVPPRRRPRRRRRVARRLVRRALRLRPGDAVAFPSATLWHRVAPVAAGARASLVLWCRRPEGRGVDDAEDDDSDADFDALQKADWSGLHDDFDDVA